jgi:hypothetical protein
MDRMGAPVYPPEHKLLCILINDFDDYRAFAEGEDGVGAEWVAGYYSPRTNRIVFFNDSTSPDNEQTKRAMDEGATKVKDLRTQAAEARREGRVERAAVLEAGAKDLDARVRAGRDRLRQATGETSAAKAVHEAIHLLAFNTGLQSPTRPYPFWLSEGLASSFETDEPGVGAFGPDHPSGKDPDAARAGRSGAPMALEQLIGLTEVPDSTPDDEGVRAMYEQSRALFTYLYRYRRRELEQYFQALLEPAEAPDSQPGPTRFEAFFGDPAALERRIRAN